MRDLLSLCWGQRTVALYINTNTKYLQERCEVLELTQTDLQTEILQNEKITLAVRKRR